MSGIEGAMGVDRVLALRQQILERNAALSRAAATGATAAPVATPAPGSAAGFSAVFDDAFHAVNAAQAQASALSEAYERGETVDIAKVMLARQQASVGFEATLQVRNKLLSAYRDIMAMPV